MCDDHGHKEVYSLSQFARMLSISRSSLYQYKETGIFPPPLNCPSVNGRPFYTNELRQQCTAILKTGIGYNGKVVVFNAKRKRRMASGRIMTKKRQVNLYESLKNIMKQVGFDVTIDDVKAVVNVVCPKGVVIDNEPDEKLILAVYDHFMADREIVYGKHEL